MRFRTYLLLTTAIVRIVRDVPVMHPAMFNFPSHDAFRSAAMRV